MTCKPHRIAPRCSSPPASDAVSGWGAFGTDSAGISKFRGRSDQEVHFANVPEKKVRALVAVHGHPLRAAAQLAIRRRADGPAAVTLCAALLQGKELLGAERLVVDLRSRLDEVLEVRAEEEVAEIDEFAVVLVLNVNDAPPVLTAADLLAIDDDGLLGTDDGEGNQALLNMLVIALPPRRRNIRNPLRSGC